MNTTAMATDQGPDPEAVGSAEAIVALGSNLGFRRATIRQAIERMEGALGPCLTQSRLIETAAVIHPDDVVDWHPPFLNGVAVFQTTLAPPEVLRRLLAIEMALGRERDPDAVPWQPYRIDLDLIGIGDRVVESGQLVLPHPLMHARRFVLEPLASVRPDWRHPILKRTVSELLDALSD